MDIVERLRSEAANWSATCGDLFGEAADDIERLDAVVVKQAAEIERLREGRDTMGNLWAKETAENAQLRTALRKITDLIDSEADEPLDEAIKIAMDALVN